MRRFDNKKGMKGMRNGRSGRFSILAIDTARRAGALLAERLPERHRVEYKGEINLVTEMDRLSEALIVSAIEQVWPSHGILAEERPYHHVDSPWRWIIDPLDGTTNYAHGLPVFCVSLAWELEGSVQGGVIYNPMLQETFWAINGKGALLNGHPLRVSSVSQLAQGLLATGFPYDIRVSEENNLNYFTLMAKRAQAIRRMGSAALDLAYVAAGRFDGFWELKLAPWDTAAGMLMVKEAGGQITDLDGNPYHLSAPHIVASNGKLHEEMLAGLATAKTIRIGREIL